MYSCYYPNHEEYLELYTTIPFAKESRLNLYLHKYKLKDQWVSSTGFWHLLPVKDQLTIRLWDWKPYPGDTAVSETGHTLIPSADHYPVVRGIMHFDKENKVVTIDSFKANPALIFKRDLRAGSYKM